MASRETERPTETAPPPDPQRGGGGDGGAAGLFLAPLDGDEGSRLGLVGDSGCGKTTAEKAIVAAYQRRSQGLTLVLDKDGQFPGQQRADLRDLILRPLAPAPRVAVFQRENPEAMAAMAFRLSSRRPRTPSLLVVDELRDCATGGRWTERNGPLARAFTEGRKHLISVLWGTQSPQEAPREAFEQSPALLVYHLGGRGLRYLERVFDVDDAASRAIAGLPDAWAPRSDRGWFVIVRRGGRWSGPHRFPIC